MHMKVFTDRYSVSTIRQYSDDYFIFGDNLLGYGKGGQAVIRDEPNAIGIPTKAKPSNEPSAFFSDDYSEIQNKAIKEAIAKIKKALREKATVWFPVDGIGTGLANLRQNSPKTWEFLCEEIYFLFLTYGARGEWAKIKKVMQ